MQQKIDWPTVRANKISNRPGAMSVGQYTLGGGYGKNRAIKVKNRQGQRAWDYRQIAMGTGKWL